MIIKFQKFQGAGNDFIIIDNRNQVYEFTREIVEYFCAALLKLPCRATASKIS